MCWWGGPSDCYNIYIYIDALVFAMWYRISLMPFQLLFPRFGPVRTLAIAVA